LNNSGIIAGRGEALASGETAGVRLFNGTDGDVTVNGDINNSGLISAETSAAILIENVDFNGTITNSGILEGTVAVDATTATDGIDFVQADGALNADFLGSENGIDSVTFAAGTASELGGNVLNDVAVTIASGASVDVQGERTVDGSVVSDGSLNFDLNEDSVSVSGDVALNTGSSVTVNNSQAINGTLVIGEAGLVDQVIFAEGDLVNNADTVFNNTGTLNGGIDASDAINGVTINQSGSSINGNVTLGSSADALNVSNSSVNGSVDLGEGADSLSVSSASINGNVSTGAGADQVAISSASVNGSIDLGQGSDSLAVSNGSINGNLSTGSGDDQVSLSNASINGTVDLGAGNDDISIANSSINGDLLLGSGDDNVVLNSGSINGQVIGQGAGEFSVNVGQGEVFNSNGVVNVGEFNIQSGRVELNGDFSTTRSATTVSQGATLAIDSPVNGGGALVVDGSLDLTPVDGASPLLTQNGAVTLSASSEIALPEFQSATDVGQNFNLIQANSITNNGFEINETNFLLDFDTANTGQNLSSEVVVTDLAALTEGANNAAFADAVAQSITAQSQATTDLADVLFEFDENNVEGFQALVDELNPSVSGAVTLGAYQLAESTQRLILNRTAESDKDASRSSLWVEAGAVSANQDNNNGVEGFDSNIDSVSVGYDRAFGRWTLGAAYGRGDADLTNNDNNGQVSIESDQFSLYGNYQANRWVVGALVSLTDFDYDLSRNTVFGGQSLISGETTGDLLDLGINGAYTLIDSSWNLATVAGLTYSSLDVDAYNEVGGLDLAVDFDDVDRLRSELGLVVSGDRKIASWTVSPTLKLSWKHDFEDDVTALNANVGGFNFAQLGNRLDEDVFNVGAGLQFSNESKLTFRIDYNGEFSSNEDSQFGSASLEYRF